MDAERSSGTMSALNRGGDSFIGGVCSQQRARPAFQSRTPNSLIQDRRSVSINVRITAVRKLAVEAADNGLLAPELANGITRVKGVASKGVRREQVAIQRAVQLDLPQVGGKDILVLYIEMDGTGGPVTATETEGRQGKNGEPAHTREVKLGCVFTQTKTDPEGRPVRDENSTTYAGAIEAAEDFGRRMYTEAWERGWSRATKKVIIANGAVWIWNIADREFPGAIQIVFRKDLALITVSRCSRGYGFIVGTPPEPWWNCRR
jgi:hypothetical protein